jgi:hypothetical protein
MAFACIFLTVVGLSFTPNELHNVSKCILNSELLLNIEYQHLGYLHNQFLSNNRLMQSNDLSEISSLIVLSFQLTILVCSFITNSGSMILNQLEAGSIMVGAVILQSRIHLSVVDLLTW